MFTLVGVLVAIHKDKSQNYSLRLSSLSRGSLGVSNEGPVGRYVANLASRPQVPQSHYLV